MAESSATREHQPIYRRNFFFFLTDNVLFNLAFNIMGPTTLIPDFIRQLTRSEVLIGLSSNLFEVGWMLPQLFIARYLVHFDRKKWWFVGPNLPVRFMVLLFALLTVWLGKDRPEAILLAFLICYGIAAVGDGVVSVPWAVMAGTSLDVQWRARMFGLTSAIAGTLMLGISPLIGLALGSPAFSFPENYALIFGAAGMLFVLSTLPGVFIHELPGGKTLEKIPTVGEFLPSLGRVLRTDRSFRSMVAARMLTSLFTMANPFYIGFATVQLGLSNTVAVPTLLAVQTIGSIFGSLLYTWLAARSNLRVIRLALAAAGLLPLSALLAAIIEPLLLYLGFFVWGLTVRTLFIGYMNWVITHSTAEQRPVYTGLFNTMVALASLSAPLLGGSIAQWLGYPALFAMALSMVMAALLVTLRFVRDVRSPQPVQ